MQANDLLGLVKFFRSEEYLDKLIGGLIHCQTPECYRQSDLEGVSDKHESCSYAWRSERGDDPIKVLINGHEIVEGLQALTVHNGVASDSWLSCWFMLQIPPDEEGLARLIDDIRRMKAEFGSSYAFLPAEQLQPFLNKVKTSASLSMWAGPVTYDDDHMLWSWQCKSRAYRYQREYRLGFGDCSVTELESHSFTCEGGLGDFLFKNPDLQIKHEQTGRVFFDLRAI